MSSRRPSVPRRAEPRPAAPLVLVVVVPGGGDGALPPWLREILSRFGGCEKPGVRRKFAAVKPAARRTPPPKPGALRKFAAFPKTARVSAQKRRRALAAYWLELQSGGTVKAATNAARQRFLADIGKPMSSKTVRRWVVRIERAGGITRAPMETFLDSKSTPHFRARKTQETQEAKKA